MLVKVPVFSLWTDFLNWMLDHTEKFPKKVRHSFILRIDNLMLDILRNIIHAAYTKEKKQILEKINLDLNELRVLLRIACTRKYLAIKSYEYAIRKIEETGKMTGAWLRSCS